MPLVYVANKDPSSVSYQSTYMNSIDKNCKSVEINSKRRVSEVVARNLIASLENVTKNRRKSMLQLSKISKSETTLKGKTVTRLN